MHRAAIALILGALGATNSDRASHPARQIKPASQMPKSGQLLALADRHVSFHQDVSRKR